MKLYLEDTQFDFGDHEGKTLKEVFGLNPAYVQQCLLTNENFVIDERALQNLFEAFPEANLSEEALDNNGEKIDQMEAIEEGETDLTDFEEFSHITETYDDGEDYEAEKEEDEDDFYGSSGGSGYDSDSYEGGSGGRGRDDDY